MQARLALSAVLLLGVLHFAQSANADPSCATVNVTAPIVGTKSKKQCVPTPFHQGFFYQDCEYVPPLGFSTCITLDLSTP